MSHFESQHMIFRRGFWRSLILRYIHRKSKFGKSSESWLVMTRKGTGMWIRNSKNGREKYTLAPFMQCMGPFCICAFPGCDSFGFQFFRHFFSESSDISMYFKLTKILSHRDKTQEANNTQWLVVEPSSWHESNSKSSPAEHSSETWFETPSIAGNSRDVQLLNAFIKGPASLANPQWCLAIFHDFAHDEALLFSINSPAFPERSSFHLGTDRYWS